MSPLFPIFQKNDNAPSNQAFQTTPFLLLAGDQIKHRAQKFFDKPSLHIVDNVSLLAIFFASQLMSIHDS